MIRLENCVYRIINKINNKVYIGSTIDSERRKLEHLSQLNRGVHINTYLQRSYDKHGKDAFIFDVIEEGLENGELLKKEQHYIDLFNSSNSNFGYNISPYANQPDGRKYIKVFVVAQRDMMKDNRLSVNAMAFLFNMQCYIEQYTNKITKPNGASFTNSELQKITTLGIRVLSNVFNELESNNIIKRIGNGKSREIYLNPNLATRGSEIQQDVFDMFK